ncbi:MAG: winged helix-turn-helix transcriptional regulator [Akkermansia sp.]|nr:winged helix-turn-helix transcriptional regulator [Akkermansia sp.]
MRAIDFSCWLLLNVSRDTMTLTQWLTLLCLVAGIATSEELADFTGHSVSTCTNILRMLEIRGYVKKISKRSEMYLVTAPGKARVKELLSFISVRK